MTVADITPDEPYTMHAGVIRAFIDHILTGAPMIADGREGLNSLMLANAMLLSTWENATINLPFDDALYAGKLAALARKKPEKKSQSPSNWMSASRFDIAHTLPIRRGAA